MIGKRVPGLVVCSLGLLGPWGCALNSSKPMTAALFVPSTASNSTEVTSEPLNSAQVASDRLPPVDGPRDTPKAAVLPDSAGPFQDIKPIDALAAKPTTLPVEVADVSVPPAPFSNVVDVARPSGNVSGQGVYMTLGGVVAVVNATPIYANQVLGPLKKVFAIKSKEMDEKQFQRFAMKEIGLKFEELVDDEMYFATAYHSLNEEDRKLAKMIAMQVRNERVTAAGGSVEQARRQSMELDGQEFDDAMQTEYRRIVHSL